jgi:uncharacterized glyoxalase superfamily protein PhnB
MPAKPIPDGFHTVNTYLIVDNSVEASQFYTKAFGAEPGLRMPGPDGKSTMHMELRIGDSTIMMTDANPSWNAKSAKQLGGSPMSFHLYVKDADALFKRAVDAGCAVECPIANAFWGDRYGKVRDPFGNTWGIATHKEDLTLAQIQVRAAEFFKSSGG